MKSFLSRLFERSPGALASPKRMYRGVPIDVDKALRKAERDREEALEALRQAEQRFRSIFENALEGIFQTTPSGTYLMANPALARIYGYDSPDALTNDVTDIGRQLYVDSARRDEFRRQMDAHGVVKNFISQIRRRDGSTIWISENVHAIRDRDGRLLYYEGTVLDISDQREAEEKKELYLSELEREQRRSQLLLLNILPGPVVERLKQGELTIADSFAEVTVLFADLVNFTQLAAELPPDDLLQLLNRIFSAFDELAGRHGIEKIKTIGDAYMAACGLPQLREDHAAAAASMALDMQEALNAFRRPDGSPLQVRIGLNSGPVVAGVVGSKKFIYDLWGDTVNLASRMESHSPAGSISITAATRARLGGRFETEERGLVEIKGKGRLPVYLLKGRRGT